MFEFYNANPLNAYEEDCVIRALSCATNKSWDEVYNELSDLAQYNGTMMDNRQFVRWYLDSKYQRIDNPPYKVIDVAKTFAQRVVLCTVAGHIICVKRGKILDTFDPSQRLVEDVWIVK